MSKLSLEAEKILLARFGADSLISLATAKDSIPYVRTVDAYYENGAFYVLTHALSGKMRQLSENPNAAVSGDWFTARGTGENLGYVGKEENRAILEKMKNVFSAWLYNGHSDLKDENTVILRIRLKSGVLFSNGVRYDIDFE